ncbi:hypothetical protein GCM10027167_41630 [Nocardia heshunensis]
MIRATVTARPLEFTLVNHREQGREALAQRLKQLRGEHSALSLRTIGQRAQVSHTTVSRAFSTEGKLPSWGSIAAITRVLGGTGSEVEPLWLWASTGALPAVPGTDERVYEADATSTMHRWFIPVCAVATIGLIILAIAHNAIPAQSSADRWLGDVIQTVFAAAATIAFGIRARRMTGSERRWLWLACLACGCWTVAMMCWIVVHEIEGSHHRGVVLAEAGFHGYSLLMLAALWLRNLTPTRVPRASVVQTVALIAVTALSVPASVWILTVLIDTDRTDTDTTLIRLTYLYPIADGAMLAMAVFASLSGVRIIQSRLLATAFGAHAIGGILATTYRSASASADLVASAEFAFTTFAVLLALAALAPTDHRTRPAWHLHIVIRVLQAVGLIAITIYTLTLATGNLPPAITPYTAAALVLLLIAALIASLPHSTEARRDSHQRDDVVGKN